MVDPTERLGICFQALLLLCKRADREESPLGDNIQLRLEEDALQKDWKKHSSPHGAPAVITSRSSLAAPVCCTCCSVFCIFNLI